MVPMWVQVSPKVWGGAGGGGMKGGGKTRHEQTN
jgi:hypothetical protein